MQRPDRAAGASTRCAIVVAGGGARRMGGIPKPWLEVAGSPIIEHVLAAASAVADHGIVVGPVPAGHTLPSGVLQTIEQPAGGGPVAAVRAAMPLLDATIDEVVLLAGDAPEIEAVLRALCSAPCTRDGVAARSDGVMQYLLARVRRSALEQAMAQAGDSMRSVFDHLQIEAFEATVPDADTWEDVARIRARSGARAMADQAWLDEVSQTLGIDPSMDVDALLALTRDVAHNLERKNAPLTSYLLGYAAGVQGLDPAQIAELAARLGAMARERGGDA